jgi:hypothetical protein
MEVFGWMWHYHSRGYVALVVAFPLDLEQCQIVSRYRQTNLQPSSGRFLFLLLFLRGGLEGRSALQLKRT